MRFRDRAEAGQLLAEEVKRIRLTRPLVLALPRGGVPVAFEVAVALAAPLDVFVARKVGAPGEPEFGIGAIAEGNGVVFDPISLGSIGLSREDFYRRANMERAELERRVRHYRADRLLPDVADRDVVLVDDGLATGVTAEAALRALRAAAPARLVLAVPVCAPDTAARLRHVADDVVCVMAPPDLYAIGQWYDDFGQTSDAEVTSLLERTVERA